jgi:RNA polymerase sigma-B factor
MLMTVLGHREREVLRLKFAEDLKQSDIAARFGVSQMQISRIVRRSTHQLGEAPDAGALR